MNTQLLGGDTMAQLEKFCEPDNLDRYIRLCGDISNRICRDSLDRSPEECKQAVDLMACLIDLSDDLKNIKRTLG